MKRWVDNILKWCDMTLKQAAHHAQDHVMRKTNSWLLQTHGTRKKDTVDPNSVTAYSINIPAQKPRETLTFLGFGSWFPCSTT